MASRHCILLVVALITLFPPRAAQQLTKPGRGVDGSSQVQAVEPGSSAERARNRTTCDPDFRTFNGVCTNKFFKLWGSTGRAQASLFRFLSSKSPRGGHLPSARFISNSLSRQVTDIYNNRGLNEFVVFFGQFVDHTVIATPGGNEEMPIPIPSDDPIFANFSNGELKFTRSKRAKVDLFGLRSRRIFNIERPINTLPSSLDLVSVYGPDEKRADVLRTFQGGKLKTSAGNLLPLNVEGFSNAPVATKDYFLAGDHRANEHPVLTSLHTLFAREHNSICEELTLKFPTWSDSLLYNMARKINGAQFQKIVADEYFPAMVGRDLPPYRGHRVLSDPSILTIFSTAAFRVGHTMVGNKISRRGKGGSPLPPLPKEDMFFRPAVKLTGEGIDNFIRGALHVPAQEVDLFVHDSLRNFLFRGIPVEEVGFDLVALNIQRGRDHALLSFNAVRSRLGLRQVNSFASISRNLAVQNALSSVYGTVSQVEAWVGMVAEDHMPGSSLGVTMAMVWLKQFRLLRDGDRLWYQNKVFDPEIIAAVPRVRALFSSHSVFREILLRNTELESSDVPTRVFF